MKKSMKVIALILMAMMMATVLFGCAKSNDTESDFEYMQDKGTLVIGITEFDPANYYDENGKLIGFDTEMAEAACKEMGLEAEFLMIDWDSKELELKSKNIDCIWNMMCINEERKEYADFSLAYMINGQGVVVKAENAGLYSDIESLNVEGLSVAFEEGSTGQQCAEESFTNAELVPVAAQTDAMLEVKAGTVDYAVIDFLTAKSMIANSDYSDLCILPDVVLAVEYDAIAFRKGSDAVEKMNEALEKIFEDGTAAALAEKYNLADQVKLTDEGN